MESERPVSVLQNQQIGQVKIADEVVAIIVGLAINEVDGIYADERRKGKKNLGKGIHIQIADNLVICDIDFVIRYGVKIPEFTNQIQQKVKSAVENMTGLEVQEVNLHITGVRSDKNEDDGAN